MFDTLLNLLTNHPLHWLSASLNGAFALIAIATSRFLHNWELGAVHRGIRARDRTLHVRTHHERTVESAPARNDVLYRLSRSKCIQLIQFTKAVMTAYKDGFSRTFRDRRATGYQVLIPEIELPEELLTDEPPELPPPPVRETDSDYYKKG